MEKNREGNFYRRLENRMRGESLKFVPIKFRSSGSSMRLISLGQKLTEKLKFAELINVFDS